jgi:predicted membrane-bound spermidine synthase
MAVITPSARPVTLRAGAGIYVGLSCVTASTLMLEIALTRIFSVTMWYHFAFVAISVALFGMTAGALAVHLLPHRFPAAGVRRQLWTFSLLFGVSVVVCFAIQLLIPFTPLVTVPGIASVVGTCIVISVPFVFSGIVVCLALTRFPDEVNRLYAVDLVGAGLGCILLVALFSVIDGPSLIVLVGGLAAVGAVAFAVTGLGRRRVTIAAVAVAVLVGFAGTNAALYSAGSPLLKIIWAKQARDGDHATERWNAFSRLVVDGHPDDPRAQLLSLVIDSTAGTLLNRWSGDLDESNHLRDEMQNLPYYIRRNPDVFVIGVGGGTDVLSALEFGADSVTGVEMNPDIIDLTNNKYGDYTGHLDEQPGVRIVNDEARSYLTRQDDRYDLIQISLIDTWAATAAGAFALTENSLYTKEAWELYMDRLNEGGVLSVTRYYRSSDTDGLEVAPLESYRTLALASQVLTDRGVENPRDHIVVYKKTTGLPGIDLATFMVSPDPISDADRAVLEDRADMHGFTPVLNDRMASDKVFADLTRPGGPAGAVAAQTADISPPTDNRPFFFQMADLDTFFNGDIQRDDYVTRPVLVLGLLAVTVIALAAACVAFPLLIGRRSPRRAAPRDVAPFYTYFLGIGLGFLLVEVAMLQRLSLFLGHPMYGLTVVLFSVLVFSGIGSMLTERIIRPDRPRSLLVPLGFLAAMVVAAGILTPRITDAMDGATTPARIATSVLLLAPLALTMGMPFSVGMRAAAAVPRAPTAFLWGINGAASVCASVMGVVIALFFGIAAAFWTGGLAYALAVASMVVITSRRAPAPAPVAEAEPEPDLVAAPG